MTAMPADILEPIYKGKVRDEQTGEEYVVWHNVPLFDEHEVVEDWGDEDNPKKVKVQYDQRLLRLIAENNNSRINDTGDFVPIVKHHTADDEDPSKDPDVFGFAGPFFVDKIGKENPRWCIFAKEWKIYADKADEARRRPRRSVEVWPEEKPESRYFDPIALLGAETPRRALGLVKYSKDNERKQAIRYEMASPGGTNTFVPTLDIKKKKPVQNQKDERMSDNLSSDAISQVIEAVMAQVGPMIDEKLMRANEDPSDDGVSDEPELENVEDEVIDPLNNDDQAFGASMAGRMFKKYSKEDGEFDSEGALQYMNSWSDDDRELVDRYMKENCDDEDQKSKYGKCCEGKDVSDPDADGINQGAAKYKKERDDYATKYEKKEREFESLQRKYRKLETEKNTIQSDLDDANEKIEGVEKKARYAKRHATFVELQNTEGVILDPDDEMKDCESLSDEQFERHIERCRTKYSKCPIEQLPFQVEKPKLYLTSSKSEKYAKAARDYVIRERNNGKDADFKKVLDAMVEQDTEDIKLN